MIQDFRAIGPTTLLAPIPAVLLSCRGTEPGFERENMITVAWAGVINSDPPMISVSIRPSRHSYAQIVQSGQFCLNLVSRAMCRAADYCGVRSGRDVNKFAETGLHVRAVKGVEGFDAPAVQEAPAFLCCRVRQRIALGSHELFLCAVEQVYAAGELFDEDGSLHLERADLIAYAHGEYHPLRARPEGFFGYAVARPEILARRLGKAPERPASAGPGKRGRAPQRGGKPK